MIAPAVFTVLVVLDITTRIDQLGISVTLEIGRMDYLENMVAYASRFSQSSGRAVDLLMNRPRKWAFRLGLHFEISWFVRGHLH